MQAAKQSIIISESGTEAFPRCYREVERRPLTGRFSCSCMMKLRAAEIGAFADIFIYIYSCENLPAPLCRLWHHPAARRRIARLEKGLNEERAGRERIRKGFLFTSHDAARESPAQRLFYKGDLQGCILTGRYLETKIAVAL